MENVASRDVLKASIQTTLPLSVQRVIAHAYHAVLAWKMDALLVLLKHI